MTLSLGAAPSFEASSRFNPETPLDLSASFDPVFAPAHDPMPRSPRPRVLYVGDERAPEFAAAIADLRRDSELQAAATVAGAEVRIERATAPYNLILLAQPRPGALAQDAAQRLRRRSPESKFAAIVGSWCEGEMRTGQPWADVRRLYWYAFPAWWRKFVCQADSGFTDRGGLVVISAPEFETASAMSQTLEDLGWSSVWTPPGRRPLFAGARVGVWVGGQLGGFDAENLDRFRRSMQALGAPTIALLDFPRHDEMAAAREMGVAAVLGKPWTAIELEWALREALGVAPAVPVAASAAPRERRLSLLSADRAA